MTERILVSAKQVGLERIDVTEILCILVFNELFGKSYGVGMPHKLLPEQFDFRRFVIVLNVRIRGGKHTARSASLIEYGNHLMAVENIVAPSAIRISTSSLIMSLPV